MSIGGLTGYQSLQDLRGKLGHVGAPFGKIRDVALRFALTKVGLDPEEDVKLVLVQSARPDPVNIIAQMKMGEVQSGPACSAAECKRTVLPKFQTAAA